MHFLPSPSWEASLVSILHPSLSRRDRQLRLPHFWFRRYGSHSCFQHREHSLLHRRHDRRRLRHHCPAVLETSRSVKSLKSSKVNRPKDGHPSSFKCSVNSFSRTKAIQKPTSSKQQSKHCRRTQSRRCPTQASAPLTVLSPPPPVSGFNVSFQM